jgi:hypothetical protein
MMRSASLRGREIEMQDAGAKIRPTLELLAIVSEILYRAKDLKEMWRARAWPRA